MADNVHESKVPLTRGQSPDHFHDPANPYSGVEYRQPLMPAASPYHKQSSENLLGSAAPMAQEPTVPNVGYGGGAYRGYRAV